MLYQTVGMLWRGEFGFTPNDKPANTCIAFPAQKDPAKDKVVDVRNASNVTLTVWEKQDCTGNSVRVAPGRSIGFTNSRWVEDPRAVSFGSY
ncbi:hypothetical protein ACFU8Q_28890 [Streptomyces sp. NPDC057543]|uniref:hypothetical protein n=1 Tax=Streptomyces sp. NPDC057543 TaxID=3346163 RepID=UPI0036B0A68A